MVFNEKISTKKCNSSSLQCQNSSFPRVRTFELLSIKSAKFLFKHLVEENTCTVLEFASEQRAKIRLYMESDGSDPHNNEQKHN